MKVIELPQDESVLALSDELVLRAELFKAAMWIGISKDGHCFLMSSNATLEQKAMMAQFAQSWMHDQIQRSLFDDGPGDGSDPGGG